MEQKWNNINRKSQRKSYPSATLSTKNPTQTALGAKLDLHSEKPATNRLSYGTAFLSQFKYVKHILSTLRFNSFPFLIITFFPRKVPGSSVE
jgi:hypothetical protein